MSALYGESCIVLRATTVTDPYSGEETPTWTNPTETEIPNCIVEPRITSEPLEAGRRAVISDYTIHMPYDTDVTAHDRVKLYGRTWDIDGRPFKWRNPYTNDRAGLEVAIKKVVG